MNIAHNTMSCNTASFIDRFVLRLHPKNAVSQRGLLESRMFKIDRRAFLGRSARAAFAATLVSAPGLMLGDRSISRAQSPAVPNNKLDNNPMDSRRHHKAWQIIEG